MSLTSGKRLGDYEVIEPLGAGGMGEVYRARDTALGREVALKVLPEAFAADPDREARFEREARVLAALNHPNIAAIYGLAREGSVTALVLELVPGETLAERLIGAHPPRADSGRGRSLDLPDSPVALDEALTIARQVADALEAAHDRGVIHRDLKPANIKVTAEGRVKVLDFGLAKLVDPVGPAEAGPYVPGDAGVRAAHSQSPTLTTPAATRAGMILGTAAYMAPEQARGRTVDKRADVWAFGCVLYELLTGRRVFGGAEVTDTLAFVITKDPDWSALPAATPAPLRTLLRRCLEKDRARRLADIADARLEIDEAKAFLDRGEDTTTAVPTSDLRPAAARSSLATLVPWGIATLALTAAATVLALWAPWRESLPANLVRLSVDPGADASLVLNPGSAAVLSPDGRLLVFVARKSNAPQTLYLRHLDRLAGAALSGTEGGYGPFFSPNGAWIGFFADGTLKKVSVSGGAPIKLCDCAPLGRGGTWTDDDTIIFLPSNQPSFGLVRVSADGGKPEPLAPLAQGELTQRWPQLLPGGKGVLYTSHGDTRFFDQANIVVQPLPGGPAKVIHRGGYHARYVASGHILFVREGTLFAAPFDLDRLETTAQPAPILEGVAALPRTGGAQFSVSDTGTLAYVPGQSVEAGGLPISWMDRNGQISTLRDSMDVWSTPQFDPAGTRLAMEIFDRGQRDLWVYELGRATASRVTVDTAINDLSPVWTPDGNRITFSREWRGVTEGLYWRLANGTGGAERLTKASGNIQRPGSWDPNGRLLAYSERTQTTLYDVMLLPIEGDEASGWKPGTPRPFLTNSYNETEPAFSPDGRWLAYISDETRRGELYVTRFPGPGGKWPISTNGAESPSWSPAARELFYRSPEGQIMVVTYAADGEAFRSDRPRPVGKTLVGAYALHPDGKRFAVAPISDEFGPGQHRIVLVFNFFDELRRVAPGGVR